MSKITYEPCSEELGPVYITPRLVLEWYPQMNIRIMKHISVPELRNRERLFESRTHDVNRRFESAAFLSLTWAF